MNQIIRELKRQAAGEKLAPEQLQGLIRAGYVYRNGDEHFLTDKGRDALAQAGVQPGDSTLADDHPAAQEAHANRCVSGDKDRSPAPWPVAAPLASRKRRSCPTAVLPENAC
jgi:hypothetical protein